jgi:hypothetical protein
MMKKNNTKKNNTARKLLPAAGMLAVSASMLATSTYAWFTMNKDVAVTGMEVRTKVSSNLLICADNIEANYSSDMLSMGRKALLEPVSSINGQTDTFFYTTDAKANGAKNQATADVPYVGYTEGASAVTLANATAGKTKVDYDFNNAYLIKGTGEASDSGTEQAKWLSTITNANMSGFVAPAYGYVDYTFYLKGTSDAASQKISLTQCNMRYDDDEITNTADKAWRVAVFSQEITSDGGKGNTGSYATVAAIDPAADDDNFCGLLALSGATNHGGTVVSTSTAKAAPTVTPTGGVVIGNFTNAGETAYYKVTVRLWLEGEDTTCTSETYAALQDDTWKLDLEFNLGNSNGVTEIGTDAFGDIDWEAPTSPTQEAPTDVNPN